MSIYESCCIRADDNIRGGVAIAGKRHAKNHHTEEKSAFPPTDSRLKFCSPLSECTTLWWPADRRPSPPRSDTIARNKFDDLATIDIGYSLGTFLRTSSVRLTKECNQSLRLWPRRLHVDVVRESAKVQPNSRIVTVSTRQTDKGATAKS